MPGHPDQLVVSRSCAHCTSAALSAVNVPSRYCTVRPSWLIVAGLHFNTLVVWLDMKEISSGNNETLDNVCECDSDVEDDEVSESMTEDKPVQARRSACRLLPFERILRWVPSVFARAQQHSSVFSTWVRGKRKYSNVPPKVQLSAHPVQLEGGFVLPLHEQNHLR